MKKLTIMMMLVLTTSIFAQLDEDVLAVNLVKVSMGAGTTKMSAIEASFRAKEIPSINYKKDDHSVCYINTTMYEFLLVHIYETDDSSSDMYLKVFDLNGKEIEVAAFVEGNKVAIDTENLERWNAVFETGSQYYSLIIDTNN